jgi:glycerate 2-kinase
LMKQSLDLEVKKIILAMGGSATVDGGTGILSALGLQFLDAMGKPLNNLPVSLTGLASINNEGLDERIRTTEIIILCDVDNRLLGDKGAAAVFGPQKGADTEAVSKLESALEKFTAVVLHQTGINMEALKFGGTAGGAAAGLHALLNARLENGIAYFLHLTGFEEALIKADAVITGEGSIDEQTLQGKGPMGVAILAKEKGKKVIGLAGKLPPAITPAFSKYFDLLLPISAKPLELKLALAQTRDNLRMASKEIGSRLSELINKK